ncbi:protein-L-isoaspartate O-methyltransferase family protein [Methylobacterium frigidaeris]|uniref:Protein-L-isoaspartate O-methyltransferase n=1 Tax=Methylobacterium frigidaeris TaxID=2038277 RepID=A0AA37HB90_9HYPH|nr:protein-L-isoaspartate(D-aspartate) O-methyltransferase [Methylobacterium frigidaeris]PIK74187.1 protein-L-isoaspartate(D-aspartate) O-methyltransferase [Methylobacterium frigidaeris]GJD62817.1 Protein-L-isoaspartate O-methyltransferase [Methylobacterium frigidaeris]
MPDLAQHRAAYAARIAARAGTDDAALIRAFARVPREAFCGPGPWTVFGADGAGTVADPAGLYRDVLVSLRPEAGLNNGEPSLHALCLAAARLRAGERVVQVGAGGGYYTAILAELVGPAGRVDAYEVEPDLAAAARAALSGYEQVGVHPRSGAEAPLPAADLVTVAAGATAPLPVWLDALDPGGRLLVPLTADRGGGGMLLATRPADEDGAWPARFLSPVSFVPCAGARRPEEAARLGPAFRDRDWRGVSRLHRGGPPGPRAFVAGEGWWLE